MTKLTVDLPPTGPTWSFSSKFYLELPSCMTRIITSITIARPLYTKWINPALSSAQQTISNTFPFHHLQWHQHHHQPHTLQVPADSSTPSPLSGGELITDKQMHHPQHWTNQLSCKCRTPVLTATVCTWMSLPLTGEKADELNINYPAHECLGQKKNKSLGHGPGKKGKKLQKLQA